MQIPLDLETIKQYERQYNSTHYYRHIVHENRFSASSWLTGTKRKKCTQTPLPMGAFQYKLQQWLVGISHYGWFQGLQLNLKFFGSQELLFGFWAPIVLPLHTRYKKLDLTYIPTPYQTILGEEKLLAGINASWSTFWIL